MNRLRPTQYLTAVVGIALIGAGGVLVARGLGDYFGSSAATATPTASPMEENPSVKWNPPSDPAPLLLAKGKRMARLEVPRLQQSFYVVEGADDDSLKRGPGHVQATAMPGEDGNCVIAGHRDLHFRFLKDIKRGDRVFLETEDGRFCYRVTGTRIISPEEVQVLQPTHTAQLHLITCFPFYFVGHAPKRYVVSAVLD